ncbi:MAG TPA: IS481 family transposase [Phenylobacterium sp.]|nr:IS481 family transposase [Phenylobacterium sp.]
MPFGERSIVSHREEFCRLASASGANVRELCRRFGVSPTTGYLWLGRYAADGRPRLENRSRRPLRSPNRTPAELEARVVAVRQAHPAWGGRKIRRVLETQGVAPPSPSTITEILRRHGLLDAAERSALAAGRRFEHAAPNDLWQMDFKGHFALGRGRCHPLTVLDDHSRYALELGACADEQTLTVQRRLQRVFERYGLPKRILADNGSPWGASSGDGRHTRLTVWLLDLGVGIVHGRPYHPQTQGKDERFHRTLKAEVLDGRLFADLAHAQAAFDAWLAVYNAQRPHDALALATPSTRYAMSPRPMPRHIPPPDYEPGAIVRKVHPGGWFQVAGRQFYCSGAFAGLQVALRPAGPDGVFHLCYRSHVIGRFDLRNPNKTVQDVPEHPFSLSPV